ncbi:MAG: hypothetical protein SVN78_00455 [Deferribacterota bacterium]|nr:hypothetical protein [Deferribacterota bacterium]
MTLTPKYCPYCGKKLIEELDSTELIVDNTKWVINHYECQSCLEVFDKINIEDEDFLDENQNNEKELE